MKNIISDSIWAHFIMFLFVMSAILPLFSTIPWLAVVIGCGYVFILFNSAMRIADFEMSDLGKLVNKIESEHYKEIRVNWKVEK
jgi:hypothetical protein